MGKRMRVLEINRYGPPAEVLEINTEVPIPSPSVGELLIEVKAVSVNPVDCAIRRGYGREVFRSASATGFPVKLGRDASGVVAAVGAGVENFRPGDAVWTAPTRATSADYITVASSEAALMPKNLSFVEAAALPFVAMTVWNSLINQVGLSSNSTPGQRVLITRGAGGVGSFAIQLIKTWGGYVASTCSTRNVEFVEKLGADLVIDHATQSIAELRDFDVVLDSSLDREERLLNALKRDAQATYITITSPKMGLVDEFGLELGAKKADQLLASRRAEQAQLGRRYHWGFMKPSGHALSEVTNLIEAGRVKPLVDRTYPLEHIADAHGYSESGRARGKIVIDMTL
jgi:NADPH:quinone reductase-like Zn-dependent oxidoreductase